MTAAEIPQLIPGAVTVAVSSGKGGVGKTTTALALAANLAARGRDVVVVDADTTSPNVHLLTELDTTQLDATQQPLEMILPRSADGYRVVTPVSVQQATDKTHNVKFSELAAVTQYAAPPEIVVIDLPPGWTDEHYSVAAALPDLVVAVVAPTRTALDDHSRHTADWRRAFEQATDKVRGTDRRRRWDQLPDDVNLVAVETMARFVGVVEGDGPDAGNQVVIRRADALDVATVISEAGVITSLPAAASISDLADSEELDVLAELVEGLADGS